MEGDVGSWLSNKLAYSHQKWSLAQPCGDKFARQRLGFIRSDLREFQVVEMLLTAVNVLTYSPPSPEPFRIRALQQPLASLGAAGGQSNPVDDDLTVCQPRSSSPSFQVPYFGSHTGRLEKCQL
uniref:Uncharacterized protein n=1 Tax=Physcomitrium patens TaxID=3218 RepID=A0A2K1J2Z6_PHYPA|nr:hypothetical protein PHYPA_021752 [Physcomitrium patens]